MKPIRIPVAACLMMLSIAACGRDPVADEANAIAPANQTLAGEASAPVTGGPPPGEGADNGNAMAAQPAGAIPAGLQGRWGLTPADCTSTRGDAKGLLVIGPDTLKFYESRATPGTSIETGTSGMSGNWNFTGEGQTWTKYVSLKLQGNNLIRTERDPVASYNYAKCD